MSKVSVWSTTPGNNNDSSPNGAQAGWLGRDVGPWARETMAAIALMNRSLGFVSYLNDLTPSGTTKTGSRTSATSLNIAGFGNNDPSAEFPPGRFCMVFTDGSVTPCFVSSRSFASNTGILSVNFDLLANSGTNLAEFTSSESYGGDEVIRFYGGSESTSGYATKERQLIGPGILSGGGTTVSRDAKFPVAPAVDGILWYNTTNTILEVTSGGSWVAAGGEFTDNGGGLTLDSAAANPTLSLKENGTLASYLYHDLSGNSLMLENGDWSSDTGTHGRIYIDDTDGKLYHQTKADAVTALAEELVPNGLITSALRSLVDLQTTPGPSFPVGSTAQGSTCAYEPDSFIAFNMRRPDWQASTAYVRGDIISGTSGISIFVCIVSGTSDSTEPTELTSTDPTGVIVDNTARWSCLTGARNPGNFASIALKWGFVSSSSDPIISFDTTVPFSSAPFIFLSPAAGGGNWSSAIISAGNIPFPSDPTATDFKYNTPGLLTLSSYYLAIGPHAS